MIEQIIFDYLNSKLDVPVYTMQPEEQFDSEGNPLSYVLIEKTGGGVTDHVPSATVAIQSYGPTLYESALLNEIVITAMEEIVELPAIGRCHLDTDYNFTDTRRKIPRYQAVYDIRYYK